MSKKVIIYLVIGLIIGAGATYLLIGSNGKSNEQAQESSTESTTQEQAQTEDSEGATETEVVNARIRGSFTYPSEMIPSDLVACAEDSAGNEVVCSTEQIKSDEFINGTGYEIEVEPVGKYFVYAKTAAGEKAYYNGYMAGVTKTNWPDYDTTKCNTEYQKTALSPKSGEVINDITLGDWYFSSSCSNN